MINYDSIERDYQRINLTGGVLLAGAKQHAKSPEEKNYANDIAARVAAAGPDLVLSNYQVEKLQNIADPDFPDTYGMTGILI